MAQNILDNLRREHAKALTQPDELQQREIRDRGESFNRKKNDLLPHTADEERGLHGLVAESRGEHKVIRVLIDRLNGISTTDEEGWVRVVLHPEEAVKSHVDREEKRVFPEARRTMDDARLLQIGDRLEETKGKAHLRSPR